jgi:hypothetical protein
MLVKAPVAGVQMTVKQELENEEFRNCRSSE